MILKSYSTCGVGYGKERITLVLFAPVPSEFLKLNTTLSRIAFETQ
ncbi:hypothetical protein LEP1GSC008_3992 [Leptospira kirschneri serovar Bulgarica str. Nikolaevo]|uniref:Uncharacterized protein n=2 Tax=Leptospira kirschneri TaxID=29507 RepID=A0A0E2B5X8_9LEPT|nr:hypothetical protein LEP1GSC081_2602 [Leptospira kirschneri str. H1]EMK23264.1 hypothetical protein LEP1GSC008_3992 [Leptospira kirschneri serovar Bulgarica str. Nikolaevo]